MERINTNKIKGLFIIVICCFIFTDSKAQLNDKVEPLEQKYHEWIIGSSNIDYDNSYIASRYQNLQKMISDAHKKYSNLSNSIAEKDLVKTWEKVLLPLAISYNTAGAASNPNPDFQSADVKAKIIHVFNLTNRAGWNEHIDIEWKDSDYAETGIIGAGGTFGNNMVSYAVSVFLSRNILSEEGLLSRELSTLNHVSKVVGPQYEKPILWQVGGLNTDLIISAMQCRMCYILSMQSGDKREKEMAYFKRLLDKALTIADGFADFIKSDYTVNHHKNPYVSTYGNEGLQAAANHVYILNGTAYAANSKSIENLSKALLAARIYSNKYTYHKGVSGRSSAFSRSIYLIQAFAQMAQVEGEHNKELQKAFLRYWDPNAADFNRMINKVAPSKSYLHTLGALETTINQLKSDEVAEKTPNGHWYFNYAGMSVHRQNEWAVIWKGIGKYLWDYEGPVKKNQNIYGKYAGAGALTILNGGKPVSDTGSGLSQKGWDWRREPGTTALNEPINDMPSEQDRLFSSNVFVGGINIDNEHALSSIEYRDNRNSMEANKSVFYFNKYIVAIGSGIKSKMEKYDMFTTVFQTALDSKQTVTYLNNDALSGIDVRLEKSNEAVSATDAVGNAYFIPKSNTFSLERIEQTMPDESGKKDYSNNFVSGRILHGKNPSGDKYEYYIEVNGGKTGAEYLKQNASSLFKIHKQDNDAHIVEYIPNKVTGYALMVANVSTGMIIDQANVPCMAMVKQTAEEEITLAVMNPEVGKIEGSFTYGDIATKETWHAKPTVQAVNITLNGNWEAKSTHTDVSVISNYNNKTILKFNCFDGKAIKLDLKEKIITSNHSPSKHEIIIYPNPVRKGNNLHIRNIPNKAQVTIANSTGKIVVVKNDWNSNQTISTSKFTPGIYLLKVKIKDEVKTLKFVVL